MANRFAIETAFNLVDNITKPLNKIGGSSSVVGKGIKKNFVEAQLRVDNFGKTVEKVTGVVKKAAFAVQGAAIAAAGAFVVSGIKGAVEFQKSMEKVGAQANLTREQITGFTSDLISLSNKTGTAVSDLANAQLHAISNGVKVADSVQFLEVAQKAATGGFMDVTKVIDSLTSALKSYGLEAGDAGKISDQMMAAARAGGVSFEDMATKLEKVLPVASKFGVSSDKLFASIATLTSQGVPIADAAKKIKSALEKDGSIKIFDKNEAVKFNEILNQITGSAGTTNEAFSRMDRTISEQWNLALNKIKNTGLKIGMELLPVIQKIIDKIALFVDKFSDMDFGPFITQIEATIDQVLNSFDFEEIVSGMQGFFTSLSNVFSMVTGLVELFFKFKDVIMAVGIGGFVIKRVFDGLVIGKNIVGFAKDVTEGFKIAKRTAEGAASGFAFASERAQAVSKAMGGIRKVGTEVSEIAKYIGMIIKTGVVAAATAIKTVALAVAQQAAAAAQWLVNAAMTANPIGLIIAGIVALIAIVILLVKNWDKVKEFFIKLWKKIKEIFQKAWEFIKDIFFKYHPVGIVIKNWETIKQFFIDLWNKVKEIFLKAWEKIKEVFFKYHPVGIVIKNWETIKQFFIDLWNKVKEIFIAAWEGIKNIFSNVGGFFAGIWNGVKNLASMIWDNLCNAFGKLKDYIKENSEKVLAFITIFTGPFGFIISIIKELRDNWGAIVEAFKTDGIIAGFKKLGGVILSAVLAPIQGLLEVLAKIPGVNKLLGPAVEKIQSFRESLKGNEVEVVQKIVPAQMSNVASPQIQQMTTTTDGAAASIPHYGVNNRGNQTITAAATPATAPVTRAEQYSYSQTTNRDQVDIAVSADRGSAARVTRQPKSPNVTVANSGGNR